jgi:RecA/RadA recombinase
LIDAAYARCTAQFLQQREMSDHAQLYTELLNATTTMREAQ